MQQDVKTTVEIDPELLYLAKKKALEEKMTLKKIISEGLKKELGIHNDGKKPKEPTSIGGYSLGGIKGGLRRIDIYEDF